MVDKLFHSSMSTLGFLQLSDKDFETFRDGLVNRIIKRIDFEYGTFGVVGMKHLCESLDLLPNLECLNFEINSNFNDDCIQLLVEHCHLIPKLKTLRLEGTNVTNKCLNLLKKISSLQELNISFTNVSEFPDFNFNLKYVTIIVYDKYKRVRFCLRSNVILLIDSPSYYLDPKVPEPIENYRLKLRKFIWLISKKKMDEFLLIEVFHCLI